MAWPDALPRRGLYLITPDTTDSLRLFSQCLRVLPARPALLQYRNKSTDPALRLAQAQTLRALTRERAQLGAGHGSDVGAERRRAGERLEVLAGERVEVDAELCDEPETGLPAKEALYRIAQEALSNIGRHSGASHVHVGWTGAGSGRARLHIVDDGCGFDTAAEHPGHFGLDNMQERARTVGAQLTIKSAPGEGTELLLDTNWS